MMEVMESGQKRREEFQRSGAGLRILREFQGFGGWRNVDLKSGGQLVDLEGAKRNRETLGEACYPDARDETDDSKVRGRELMKKSKKSRRKEVKSVAELEGQFKEGQSPDKQPTVPKGKKAIWHKPYTYQNKAGKDVTIRGHWEIVNLPKEKPKVEESKVEKSEAED